MVEQRIKSMESNRRARRYLIGVREVHVSMREVEAYSEEEALNMADDISCEVSCEYSYTMDKDNWSIEVIDE